MPTAMNNNTAIMDYSKTCGFTAGSTPNSVAVLTPGAPVFVKDSSGVYEAIYLGPNNRFHPIGSFADVQTIQGEPKVISIMNITLKPVPSTFIKAPTPGPSSNHEAAPASAGTASATSVPGAANSSHGSRKSSTDIPVISASTSWADIQDATAALAGSYSASEHGSMGQRTEPGGGSNTGSDCPEERFNTQKSSREYEQANETFRDENGNKLPAWLGPKDRIVYGYTKMWYYNKYWGYVEPFEDGSHDVFLHGGKVVNSKKNVSKMHKKRERGIRGLPDHSMWLSKYTVVPKVVRYQKVLMTDFFMNTEEKEGRRLAANTIIIVDPAWNKTRALTEIRRHKGVKVFEDKKHGIDREMWMVGDQCLAQYQDGEDYPATIVEITKADYPNVPEVYVQFRDFGTSAFKSSFTDITVPASLKRQLDARRCNSGRARSAREQQDDGKGRAKKKNEPAWRALLTERRQRRDRIISSGQAATVPPLPPQWEPADERTPSPVELTARQQMMSAVQSAATSVTGMTPRDDVTTPSLQSYQTSVETPKSATTSGLRINVPMNPAAQFVPQGMAPGVIPANYFNGMQGLAPIPVQGNAHAFLAQQQALGGFNGMYQPHNGMQTPGGLHSQTPGGGGQFVQSAEGLVQQAIPLPFVQQAQLSQTQGQEGDVRNGTPGGLAAQSHTGGQAAWQNPMFIPQMMPGQMQQITTWVVDSMGRWTCAQCNHKNQAVLGNCAQCGAQREMTTIPFNQMSPVFMNHGQQGLGSPGGLAMQGGLPIMGANMVPYGMQQPGFTTGATTL